jgi:hypothetical protein
MIHAPTSASPATDPERFAGKNGTGAGFSRQSGQQFAMMMSISNR